MLRGKLNQMPAVCRVLCVLGLVGALLTVSGCGGKDEAEQVPPAQNHAMVPVDTTMAVADTAAGVAAEAAEGTSAAEVVQPVATATEAVTTPREEPATESVSKPFSGRRASAGTGAYSLQLGSFRSEANALALIEKVLAVGYRAEVEVASLGGQTYHRVVLRGLADRTEAERLGEDIHSQLGITYLIRQK